MAETFAIGRETVAEFIQRHGGVANTSNIAGRFGWSMREAKRRLEALASTGQVEKAPAHVWDHGKVCSWRVAAPGKTA